MEVAGTTVQTLGPRDALAHTCHHAARDDWRWIRSLVDVHRLARHPEAWDGPLSTVSLSTLRVTEAMLGLPTTTPPDVRDDVRRAPRRLVRRAVSAQDRKVLAAYPFPAAQTLRDVRYRLVAGGTADDAVRTAVSAIIPPKVVAGLDDPTIVTALPRALLYRARWLLHRAVAWLRRDPGSIGHPDAENAMRRRARAYLALMASAVGSGAVVRLVLLQLLVAVMEAAGLTLLVPVLQSLNGRDTLSLPGFDLRLSVPEAFALVLVVVSVRALGQWRVAVLSVEIRLATIDALRLGLIDDLYAAEWGYLAGQRRSHVIQRLTTEVERAHNALFMLIRIIVGLLVLLATIAVAILLSPAIGGLAAVGLIAVVVASRRSVRSAVSLGEQMSARMDDFGAALSDSLSSVRLMRAHDASAAWSQLVAAEAGGCARCAGRSSRSRPGSARC